MDRDHLTLVAMDLAGEICGRIVDDRPFAMPQDVVSFVESELPRLLARAGIDRRAVIGAGIAIPDDLGRIVLTGRPEGYGIWSQTDPSGLLATVFPWPILVDNDAAAAALGEIHRIDTQSYASFFYLLITAGLGGGVVLDRCYHRGRHGRSGEIGLLPDRSAGADGRLVQDEVSIFALQQRFRAAGLADLSREEWAGSDPAIARVVDRWLIDSARVLAPPLAAVSCLFDPDAVLIGGRLPHALSVRLAACIEDELTRLPLPSHTPIMLASNAEDGAAVGAAMLPFLHDLLPSEAVLSKGGPHG